MVDVSNVYCNFIGDMETDYGCSFVAKPSWKKYLFWGKIFVLFTKYTLFAEKNVFIWEKSFIMKNFILKKTCFKYISHFKSIFLHRKCLCYK